MYNGITIYTITYNEEIVLPFFIEHYRKNFPNCRIVIYDNESTDSTVEIAKKNNCEVILYNTNNQISDRTYLDIKNNCWLNSKTHWNIICDCDEFCDITEHKIIEEDKKNVSIINLSGYDMVNLSDDENSIQIRELTNGYKNNFYNKSLIFNKEKILSINYEPGCHKANPIGVINYSDVDFKLLHYKYIGMNYLVLRYELFENRLSDENKKLGWGVHYRQTKEKILEHYKQIQKNSVKIL
jgi:hypothetical protein